MITSLKIIDKSTNSLWVFITLQLHLIKILSIFIFNSTVVGELQRCPLVARVSPGVSPFHLTGHLPFWETWLFLPPPVTCL